MIENRRSKRKAVNIEAEIVSGDAVYSVLIENIAELGICIESDSTDLLKSSTKFNPGKEFEIKFRVPSGDDVKLHCKVIWSYQAAPHGLKRKIGMEIIFPPPGYVDFCNSTTNEPK